MKRSLSGHVAFFVVALAAALWAWRNPAGSGHDEVLLLDASADALTRVHYRWPDGEVSLAPGAAGAQGDTALLAVTHTDRSRSAPPGEPPAERTARPLPVVTRFPAGRAVSRALAQLAPLRALRSLGVPPAAGLIEMGLGKDQRALELEAHGTTLRLEVGEETYGRRGRYLRHPRSGEVFVIEAAALRGLEGSALRLMEPVLLPVSLEDITRVHLRRGPHEVEWLHVDRDQPGRRYFAGMQRPGEEAAQATGVVEGLRNLRARAYVPPPDAGLSPPDLEATFHRAGATPLTLRLFASETQGNAETAAARVSVGPWWAEVSPAAARKLIEQVEEAVGDAG